MSKANFSDDFKRDAVFQITERGYPVAEVSQRLGVTQHSLYAWKRKFSKASGSDDDDKAAEIRRLKRELARVTEARDNVYPGRRSARQMTKQAPQDHLQNSQRGRRSSTRRPIGQVSMPG